MQYQLTPIRQLTIKLYDISAQDVGKITRGLSN